MSRKTIRELRSLGITPEAIDLARATQAGARQGGHPVQSIAVIIGASQARPKRPPNAPAELTDRALRKRGVYDQAALLLDQQALTERDPDRAVRARAAAQVAKELSPTRQGEFDFLGGGNVGVGREFHREITKRLRLAAPTLAKSNEAIAVLWEIVGNLAWQSYECSLTAADLCELTGVEQASMARALALLEKVGAIHRVKRGRSKVIVVTPEGAFRGSVHEHAKTVERYRLEVIEGGRQEEGL